MNRAKKRKLVKIAREGEMQKADNWPVLEDTLEHVHNAATRAQLRSRILRGK